jgi:biopolymer transport protein ExbD
MRYASPFRGQQDDLEIKMTPMIDVIFLLLIFFVWTASFQIAERVLPSDLSDLAASAPAPADEPPPVDEDFDKVVLRVLWVNGQPAWRVNQIEFGSLLQVQTRLEEIAAIKRDAPLVLHPDEDVPLGHVIDLYDLTRVVGFEQIQFAVSDRT